ncbi:MAG TPA: UDP-glucose/GDP-mannose dehydrogenase family protein [Kofleriaceae bacterium]|jgi:UDPglucose 6-dehydrogenase|nr:UDP-glucose/GDP-mannose dehydrogenase family protein [Kofleriaceae bacterium]
MKLAVVGTGYVGLVTGAGFSDFGHDVTCVDIDAARIAKLRNGDVPFYEPGLHDLIRRNTGLGRLRFTTSTAEAVAGSQIAFIAVGTPSADDGSADLGHVLDAAAQIGAALTQFTVVVTKSTVPVGTADNVRDTLAKTAKQPFAVASNPEFLKEGDAVNDFLKPARVVVGANEPRAIELLRDLYRGMLRTNDRIQIMDVRSAELTKYAANCMLATRISFMNELARLCEATGADIEAVRKGIGSDPRIGNKFLFAGAGFGGSCFPKDLRALIHTAKQLGVELDVVTAAEAANERQKRVLGDKLLAHFGGDLRGKRVGVWGLAFKPETDDIRESPALVLIDQLRAAGATIAGYDPEAMPNVRAQLGDAVELVKDAYAAAAGADALVLVTEWHELRDPDYARLRAAMRTHVLVDGRNVWSPADARDAGFTYFGIGRP